MSRINIRIYLVIILILLHLLILLYELQVIPSNAIFLLSYMLVLLPEDEVRPPKHVGKNTLSCFIYIYITYKTVVLGSE